MLRPVERVNLSGQVFDQLRDHILNEEYQPGERLPSERELCDMLGVNRSSVREALKRLEQARLIEIRHGGGSTVLDFRLNAGIELMRDLVMPAGRMNHIAIRSILEFRSLIGPEIARIAALRIQEEELQRIGRIVERIEACSEDDVQTLQDLDFEFHYTMCRAGENLALLLILNSIRDTYFHFRNYFAAMFSRAVRSRGLYRRIHEALRVHDEERAGRLCAELIEKGNRVFLERYEVMQSGGPETTPPGPEE